MDSATIETQGCPLDPDLLKSWDRFSLESSHSHTSSDHSESADEDTADINHDNLLQQLKNLSLIDVSAGKSASSECSNRITETNSLNKNNYEKHIFVENEENEGNQTSYSSLENEDLLKFVAETDVKSVFPKCSYKDCGKNFQNINNTEKHIFENKTENDKNQFSYSSVKNNKILNNIYKGGSDISTGYESDSDDEEVTLRERYPQRHNRPENNRQLRTTPFPQNHTKTYKQDLYSYNYRAPVHFNHNISNYGYDSLNDIASTNFEKHSATSPSTRTFHSCFPSPESVIDATFGCTASNAVTDATFGCTVSSTLTDATFGCTVSSTVADQIVDDLISCTASHQTVNGGIPRTITDQTVNDVIPYAVTNRVSDSVVPSAYDTENGIHKLSPEISNILLFDNSNEKIFSESNDRGYILTDLEIETLLDSYVANQLAEENDHMLKNDREPKADTLSCQNLVDFAEQTPFHVLSSKEAENVLNNYFVLNHNNKVPSTFNDVSHPKNNPHNFETEPDHFYSLMEGNVRGTSFCSSGNGEETSFYSISNKNNSILENSSEFSGHENLVNKPGNYSDMVSKHITSINRECVSPKTSNYINISEEIEQEIEKLIEKEESLKKKQNNVPEFYHPLPVNNRDNLPFVELDDNSFTECFKTPKFKATYKKNDSKRKNMNKKNDSKRKNMNQTQKSTCKAEKPKICWMLGTEKRDRLLHSSFFSISNWEFENEEIRQQIESGKFGTEKKKVIHPLNKNRKTKYRGTNLHYAIISENTEKVFCIVECHKECHETICEINLRDSFNKTVLDYAKEKRMDLLADYLEENNAKESVNV